MTSYCLHCHLNTFACGHDISCGPTLQHRLLSTDFLSSLDICIV